MANCDPNAACTDTAGSFTCACNPPYVGNGVTCAIPVCGNNVLEPGEVCDDGNQTAGDNCRADCHGIEVCGDGLTDYLTEECDDGNDTDPMDGCHQCKLPPVVDVPAQKINGTLVCPSGGAANTGRKISSDARGNFYVVMLCGGEAFTTVSINFGTTWSTPITTGITNVLEASIEGGSGGIAYVAAIVNSGQEQVVFTRSTNAGTSWEPVQVLIPAVEAEVSIDSFGNDVFIETRNGSGGLTVSRNQQSGTAGAWTSVDLVQTNIYHDVIVDKISGAVISASDDPAFHVRVSTDGGVTFGAQANPPGQAFYSDWAGSRGLLYTTGTFGGTDIDIIPLSAPGTSTQVNGLPANGGGQFRAIDADPLGNAYVVSLLGAGGIQLDRMVYQSGAILPADVRLISATGSTPGVAGLPNSAGALVVYRNGNDIFAAVEVY
jgi:cysteine-rich repeat protein